MNPEFWRERWQQKQIGFHQSTVHPMLLAYWSRLAPKASESVFVPLCGKSLDMWWLREQGHEVVGVELSQLAVEQFFAEAKLTPQKTQVGSLERWSAQGVTIYCGDFFALTAEQVANCSLVFDRAALIALPLELRDRYRTHLNTILPKPARTLLITIEYAQNQMSGPPFSVPATEVKGTFAKHQLLTSEDAMASNANLAARGVTALSEAAWRIDY